MGSNRTIHQCRSGNTQAATVSLAAACALVATTVLLVGCVSAPARYRRPSAIALPTDQTRAGWTETGFASWYGEPYHGRATASGERYDMHAMTAAHRTLPFGTLIHVINRDTQASVEVTINDRGPFIAGRILDLSRSAAERLGAIGCGVVPVSIEVLKPGDGMLDEPCWEVQVGAFGRPENVDRAERTLVARGLTVRLASSGGGLTRVRATGLAGREGAIATARLLDPDFPGAIAVPCPGGR